LLILPLITSDSFFTGAKYTFTDISSQSASEVDISKLTITYHGETEVVSMNDCSIPTFSDDDKVLNVSVNAILSADGVYAVKGSYEGNDIEIIKSEGNLYSYRDSVIGLFKLF